MVCCAGKHCIEVNPTSKSAFISEELCIGCGICVKVFALQLNLMQLLKIYGMVCASTVDMIFF